MSIEEQNELDEEFLDSFGGLHSCRVKRNSFEGTEPICYRLIDLVRKGASAKLLDNYELGGYNLARFAEDLKFFDYTAEQFELIVKTFRFSILADADVINQKAYVGNGGVPIIYWLSSYFLYGLQSYERHEKNIIYHTIYFQLFIDLIAFYPETVTQYNSVLFVLHDLQNLPKEHLFSPKNVQFEFYFSIIYCLLNEDKENYFRKLNSRYFGNERDIEEFQNSSFKNGFFSTTFRNLSRKDLMSSWIPILLPFNNNHISNYIDYQFYAILKENLDTVINSFKGSKQSRVFFREFFSQGKHWLLDYIIKNKQESIFQIVKCSELELLIPFCKNYPNIIRSMKNDKNQTLLDFALSQKKASQKIIEKLKSMNVPVLKA